jgi:chromate reductase, NAD(P)H dehydrogenase (quinone)
MDNNNNNNRKIKILGIAGSLRKASFNRGALRAAKELAPDNSTIEIFESVGDIPPFNQDLENPPPRVVADLKQKIRSSDAILFVTPEYNYSISGVLKNLIDWASRPYGDNAWDGKPVAIMGASPGMTGTARAQYHLRQMFVFLNMRPLNRPEVMLPLAADGKFDTEGNLVDPETRKRVKELVDALVNWTIMHQRMMQQYDQQQRLQKNNRP